MMAQSETSYFSLRPCDKQIGLTDPKPEPHLQPSTTSANTSSVEAGYIHDLGLPSLPSLSQLLTTEEKPSVVPADAQNMTTTTTSAASVPANTTTTSTACAVIQALSDAQQQQQQEFFTSVTGSAPSTTVSSPVHSSLPSSTEPLLSAAPSAVSDMTGSMGMLAPSSVSALSHTPVTTAPLTMLMDPTSAAAAAAAAAMYLPPQNGLADSATTAVAAAALMASNPMLPQTTTTSTTAATTGNPSSFYNIAPSATSTTATSSPTMTDQHINNNNINNAGDLVPPFMMPSTMDTRDALEKNYSFVSIPGANQRKRPRRRYDEIERLYHCTWPNCTKSYGTLNHLNAHVSMQKHGAKRHPSEFKEMRRNWRRQKKEREAARKAAEKEGLASNMANAVNTNMTATLAGGHPSMMQPLQSYNSYAPFPSMYTSLPQAMGSIGGFY